MRSFKPSSPVLLLLLSFLLCGEILAQKSAAELISEIPPPRGKVQFNDGARQVNIRDHYLFITNIWAGLQILDISDVNAPQQVAYLPSSDEAFYTDIDGDYAFVANQSTGVQIYDIRDMSNVSNVAEIKPPGNAQWIISEFPYLYVALGREGFCIMDLSDLNNPITIKLEIPGQWIQQLDKKDNLLFLAAKKGGLIIYDVSDKENPRKLSQFRTDFNTMMVQVVDKIAYLADGPGGLLCMNVENPEFPLEISRVETAGFVGNLHKVGNYAYLANRDIGLQIVNVSNPARPFLESRYATDDKCYGVYKKDIYVYLAANTSTMIMRHNNSPLLERVGDRILKENEPFILQLNATEPDGDAIVYEAINIPEGSTFDTQSGLFEWTPTFEQSGDYPNVIFRVIEQTRTNLGAQDTVNLAVQHVNRLPDLPALESLAVDENALLSYAIPAGTDPDIEDQNRLTYRAEKLPKGAAFDTTSRTFNWTPGYDQSGLYVADFLIDDGGGGIDREPVTITVQHIDRPPVADPVAAQAVDENETLELDITGIELDAEDQNQISFAMSNLPAGASFDPATQKFNWTPTYDQSGTYADVGVIMTAGQYRDTTRFDIVANHVNRSPLLNDIPDPSTDENQLLQFTITGSDPDKEDAGKLTYTALNLPDNATFDPVNKVFSWNPTFEQSGQYSAVSFTVQDPSGLSDTREISITVNHVNRPPVIAAASNQTFSEEGQLTVQLSASDPDVEDEGQLVFAAIGLPEGALLDAQSGNVSWSPNYDQSGEYFVTYTISDGQFTDSTSASYVVSHVNRTPELSVEPLQVVDENQALTFTISGSDPDIEDNGLLSYRADALPEGAAFDMASLSFSWTPTFDQSGEHKLLFAVNDPAGLTAQAPVTVTVNHVNRAPQLDPVGAQTVAENETLSLQLSGSDPDAEDAGKLRYTMNTPPPGAELDALSGAFTWSPSFEQAAAYSIELLVSDPAGLSANQIVTVAVTNVNRPPAFETTAVQKGKENEKLEFTVFAVDPDSEDKGRLVYAAEGLPGGAVLNSSNGRFSWTPTFEQAGDYLIQVEVEDSFGETASLSLPLQIAHVSRPPTLPGTQMPVIAEDQEFSFELPPGSDLDKEDTNKLTYRVDNLPSGARFDAANRVFSWKPTFQQAGSYKLSYIVSDGTAEGTSPIEFDVSNVNRAPKINVPGNQLVKEGASIAFKVSGTDPDVEDAGKLSLEASSLPAGAKFSSGEFSWTPDSTQQGSYTVEFLVRDPAGVLDKASLSITVEDVIATTDPTP